jgi:MraZ protein
MAVPSRYRDKILSRCSGELVITADVRGTCLMIYMLPDWEEFERKLARSPTLHPAARRLQALMQGYASDVEMDSHGRILVPRLLREVVSLEKQCMLVGQGVRFELWDEERWTEQSERWRSEDADFSDLPPELGSLFF